MNSWWLVLILTLGAIGAVLVADLSCYLGMGNSRIRPVRNKDGEP